MLFTVVPSADTKSFTKVMCYYFFKCCPVQVSGFKLNTALSSKGLKIRVQDLDARPWDFQAEECALRASVDRFNTRRYSSTSLVSDLHGFVAQ